MHMEAQIRMMIEQQMEIQNQRLAEMESQLLEKLAQLTRVRNLELNAEISSCADKNSFRFLPKLEFPSFDGTNPRNWIKKCSRYFALCKIPDSLRVDVASIHLTGKAETWFASYIAVKKNVDWCDFILDIYNRFKDELGSRVIEDFSWVIEDFPKLQQTGPSTLCSGNHIPIAAHQVFDESPKSNPDSSSHDWVGEGQGKSPVGFYNAIDEHVDGLNPSNGLLGKSLPRIPYKSTFNGQGKQHGKGQPFPDENSGLYVLEESGEEADSEMCLDVELLMSVENSKALGLSSLFEKQAAAMLEKKNINLLACWIPKNPKWKEANGFYSFVFDPGKLGVGQSTLQPKPLAFMYARMVEILATSKVSVVIFVFDPGEERVTTVFSSDPEKFVSWHTSAQVIADVAGIKVPREEWPDRIGSLLNNITQTVSSASLKQTTLDTVILAGSTQNSHVDQVDRGMEHNACASHGDSELGQYASAQLLLLAPENPAPYVQLINIFSAKGKWRDRAMAIKKMTEAGLAKETIVGTPWNLAFNVGNAQLNGLRFSPLVAPIKRTECPQVQGKDRSYVKHVAEQLGLDGSYDARTYTEQILLEKLVNDVMALPDDLKTKLSIEDNRRNKHLSRNMSHSFSTNREKHLSKLTKLAVDERNSNGVVPRSLARIANQGAIIQFSDSEQISTLNESMNELTSHIEQLNSTSSIRRVFASQQNLASEVCNGSAPPLLMAHLEWFSAMKAVKFGRSKKLLAWQKQKEQLQATPTDTLHSEDEDNTKQGHPAWVAEEEKTAINIAKEEDETFCNILLRGGVFFMGGGNLIQEI